MPADESILTKLASVADDVPAEIERLQVLRAQIDAEIERLRRFQRIFGVAPVRVTAKSKKHASNNATVCVGDAILALNRGDGVFTALEVNEGLDYRDATIYAAFSRLRDLQFIGKAGMVAPASGTTKRQGYRILDAHVLDALRSPNGNQ